MKKALVCGAGGFIGHHLVKYLKSQGYWVRGVDQKLPEFEESKADQFIVLDLRKETDCNRAMVTDSAYKTCFDEVYQLAADMGGMGFIHSAECDIMHNSVLINTNMINKAIRKFNVDRYFFSSSVCIYRDMAIGEPALTEADAFPAQPDNEYGWEKIYSERMAQTFGRHCDTKVRIARFQNCFGPLGTWEGGREKAPAAISRKVAEIEDGGTIEIWGDGSAVRSYTYIDDMLEGIYGLMHSDLEGGTNIGNPEYISVNELVDMVVKVSGKKNIKVKHIDGPVGVQSRNFSNDKIYTTGWKANHTTLDGIAKTYHWIEQQVKNKK